MGYLPDHFIDLVVRQFLSQISHHMAELQDTWDSEHANSRQPWRGFQIPSLQFILWQSSTCKFCLDILYEGKSSIRSLMSCIIGTLLLGWIEIQDCDPSSAILCLFKIEQLHKKGWPQQLKWSHFHPCRTPWRPLAIPLLSQNPAEP